MPVNEDRLFPTVPASCLGQKEFTDKLTLLFSLGHFQDYVVDLSAESYAEVLRNVTRESNHDFVKAVKSYQRFCTGLEKDGVLGPLTAAAVSHRTCGHPDRTPNFDCVKHEFGGGQPRWVGGPVACYWSGDTLGEINLDTYLQAAEWWARDCGIEVVVASRLGTADVWAVGRFIDGMNNTLAWSFSPRNDQKVQSAGGRVSVEQRFDTGDVSTYNDRQSAITIMNHEQGHAFHFDGHTDDPADVMFPSFTGPMTEHGENELQFMRQAYPIQDPPPPDPDDEWEEVARWQVRVPGEYMLNRRRAR